MSDTKVYKDGKQLTEHIKRLNRNIRFYKRAIKDMESKIIDCESEVDYIKQKRKMLYGIGD